MNRNSNDWVFGIFLVCMVILAGVIYNKFRRFRQITNTFKSYRNIHNLVREGNLFTEFSALLLFMVFSFTSSLLIYFAAMGYQNIPGLTNEGAYLFLKITAAFTLLYLFRIFMNAIIGYVFKNNELSYYYVINIFVIDLFLGIILLPLLILLVYLKLPFLLYMGFFIYAAIFLYRLLRGIIIGSSGTKFSKVYLILYLCTLEILPLIVLVKLTVR